MPYDIKKIEQLLSREKGVGTWCIDYFDEIDSTNSYLLSQNSVTGRVCLAESQSRGRGRRGRQWIGVDEGSILMSMGWSMEGQNPSGLSLVSGLATKAAISEAGINNVKLKWPNDLLIDDRKLGGILVEFRGHHCVIGIGLNIDIPDDVSPHITGNDWIDLRRQGIHLDRDELTASLVVHHDKMIKRFREEGFKGFMDEWNATDAYQGQHIKVSMPDQTMCGIAKGVDKNGALRIDQDGKVLTVISGETSVRPQNRA